MDKRFYGFEQSKTKFEMVLCANDQDIIAKI